jgi:hypothetical protein
MDGVAALIDGFETPFGMELLATTHWVMAHDPAAHDSPDAAVKGVKDWDFRKARIMGPEQIRVAWERLRGTALGRRRPARLTTGQTDLDAHT